MLKHIKTAQDLVTTRAYTVRGFLVQSLYKGDSAHPYVKSALAFSEALAPVKNIGDLFKPKFYSQFKLELIAAASFSDKSAKYFTEPELQSALKKAFAKIYAQDKENFKQELLFRCLLTKGDSLGGSSRNKTGALASNKLAGAAVMRLKAKHINPIAKSNEAGKVQSLQWPNRILSFDVKSPLVNKNIDAILFDTKGLSKFTIKEISKDPDRYLACGELKGGVDPAGADEHWKTANSALGRIRNYFSENSTPPKLFFVGAAIEQSMAQEIFAQIKSEELTHVANLNYDSQFNDLIDWLVTL